MNSLIYIEIINQLIYTYQKEFLLRAKEALPALEIFDLDNHSEPALFTYAADLIRKSNKCALVLKVEKEAPVGRIMILLEEVLKNKDKILLIVNGENPIIEKMLKQIQHQALNQNEDQSLSLVTNFLKPGSNPQ